jgi:hypothetical protein
MLWPYTGLKLQAASLMTRKSSRSPQFEALSLMKMSFVEHQQKVTRPERRPTAGTRF